MDSMPKLTIYTFFRLDKGGMGEDASIETATILAKHFEEARQTCIKQFIPDAYHEIELEVVNDLNSHYRFAKHPKPIMLRNLDDIKEI